MQTTISLSFAGQPEAPTAVSLLTLTDAATGADVSAAAGLTLPVAFTQYGAAWQIVFTDTGAAAYGYSARLQWTDGTTSDLFATAPGSRAAQSSGTPTASGATINPGGRVTLSRAFTYAGGLQDFDDPGPTYTLYKNDTAVSNPTITTSHPSTGRYRAVATCTGFDVLDSGELEATATYGGETYTWRVGFTVVAGGATTVVTPLAGQVATTFYATKDLPRVPAGSAPSFAWTITDATGAAVDLSAKVVRFVAASAADSIDPFSETETPLFKYESIGESGIVTISGAGSNVVTANILASDTAAHVGDLRYWLLNASDMQILAAGKLPIIPAALDLP